jgi:hypothetical protein
MCGITSLTTCWNYLFSHLGAGVKQPISTEEAAGIIGIHPPYDLIPFGDITSNQVLMEWFQNLNDKFGVKGTSKIFYKLHGEDKTDKTSEEALKELKEGLRSEKKAYIYHAEYHYFLIIGYESNSLMANEAYSDKDDFSETEEWIIIGEISFKHAPMHIKKWDDIVFDLGIQYPKFFDIRETEKGVQEKPRDEKFDESRIGNNVHCIIEFSAD